MMFEAASIFSKTALEDRNNLKFSNPVILLSGLYSHAHTDKKKYIIYVFLDWMRSLGFSSEFILNS